MVRLCTRCAIRINVLKLLKRADLDAGTGGILLWRLSPNTAVSTFGSRSDDAAYEKEVWTAIKMIK